MTKWQIYPADCNMHPLKGGLMVHGGAVIAMADKQAAIVAKENLKGTNLVPLTVGITECKFLKAATLGDTIDVVVHTIKPTTKHRMDYKVEMFDEYGDRIFTGLFSFCSFSYNNSTQTYELSPHNL